MESVNTIPPTIKEYLEDSYKFKLERAKLIRIEEYPKEPESSALIFDRTIFHPQGGGQPSDEGVIESISNPGVKLNIEAVAYDRERDIVLHKVKKDQIENNLISVEDEFQMTINEEKRRLNARLHSAGHLLDIAIFKLGLDLVPGKGYHFPDAPYVEYVGNIDKAKIQTTLEDIERVSNEIIQNSNSEDFSITKTFQYEEAVKESMSIPTYLPENKPFRWVKLLSYEKGCPCGGTHVKHVKDIFKMKINKIVNKGKAVRVCYSLLL